MRHSNKIKETNKDEFQNLYLKYEIKNDFNNDDDLKKMKDILRKVGINLSVNNDVLTIAVYTESYTNITNRNAGRRGKVWQNDNGKSIYYSDIVFMSQQMSKKEIRENINMPIATFTRHYKTLMESNYYKSLDTNRLNDLDYLKSVGGNYLF